MSEMKTLNGYEVVDAKARADIKGITVPTKTSDLTNDSGFLTTVPSEYVTEAELANKKYLTSVPSEYVTESELATKGYITQHQSLSGYAKTADHYTKTESDNKYQAKGNYLTSVPTEYVTETELNARGYLTAHQDISGKADKSSAETWTFTLADGSTVTKKVVLA